MAIVMCIGYTIIYHYNRIVRYSLRTKLASEFLNETWNMIKNKSKTGY